MATDARQRNPVELLAEEFLARYRRGERPSLTEYVERHPELAVEIRELFPALAMMEEAARPVDATSESSRGQVTADGSRLERLGDYRILREIGRGGMGIVYEAEHEKLGRRVALKVLPLRNSADAKSAARFRREARATARLHHTNIVPLFDVGECNGLNYFAMQYIEGQGLHEVLVEVRRLRGKAAKQSAVPGKDAHHADGALPLEQTLAAGLVSGDYGVTETAPIEPGVWIAEPGTRKSDHCPAIVDSSKQGVQTNSPGHGQVPVTPDTIAQSGNADSSSLSSSTYNHYFRSVAQIGLQVADALAYAHKQGIFHRDIKPSNLLLDRRGSVWVADFGLVKEIGDDFTQTGDVVGTLRYMAPERFRGVSNAQCDIYSLGLTLYELLTLQSAFGDSDQVQLLRHIVQNEPRAPRRLDPRVPLDLETIVVKAISKEPGRRYPSADALADDLRRYLSNRPIQARPVMLAEKGWLWCRRNPAIAGLLGTIALLGLVLLLGGYVAHVVKQQRDRALAAEAGMRIAKDEAEAAHREAQAGYHFSQAIAIRHGGTPGRKKLCLDEIHAATALHPSAGLRDRLRNEAIAALALTDVRFVEGPDGLPGGCVLDPDYKRYAVLDDELQIIIGMVDNKQVVQRLRNDTRVPYRALVFSPDGKWLVATTGIQGARLQAWNIATAKPAFTEPISGCFAFELSSDNSLLAVCRSDKTVQVMDLASGREVYRLQTDRIPKHVTFDPVGRRLAVCYDVNGFAAQIWDLHTHSIAGEIPADEQSIHGAAWHPDGKLLALAFRPPAHAEIWDVTASRRLARLEGHTAFVNTPMFDATGDLVITSSWDGTTRVWRSPTGRTLAVLQQDYVTFGSRDGRYASWRQTGSQVKFIEWDRSPEFHELTCNLGDGEQFLCLSDISRDGRFAAAATNQGIALWDLATGHLAAQIPSGPIGHLMGHKGVVFHPNGRKLIANNHGALVHWPLASTDHGSIRVGPPQRFSVPFSATTMSVTADGNRLALAMSGRVVITTPTGEVQANVATLPDHDEVVVSPDGRWIVTGGWQSPQTQVWKAESGDLVKVLELGTATRFAFDPESTCLITCCADEYCFWDLATWQKLRTIARDSCPFPGPIAFSPDGQTVAIEPSVGVIRLFDRKTDRTWALLEGPRRANVSGACFSPDGTRLTASVDFDSIVVWDLLRLRQSLRKLGLDWDQPPLGTSETRIQSERPLQVEIVGPDASSEPADEISMGVLIKQAEINYAAHPDSPEAANGLAWYLATAPTELRDVDRAVRLAKQAVGTKAANPAYRNTLGVAYYRAGRYRDAIEMLEFSRQAQADADLGCDLYFLAMARHQLGETGHARDLLELARTWQRTQKRPPPKDAAELNSFRNEAEALINGDSPK